ncbi:MAG: hypothetical protein IPP07_23560 [Holophagales bacterium]|nr:hypothetical protein [Holophagales bacterium]
MELLEPGADGGLGREDPERRLGVRSAVDLPLERERLLEVSGRSTRFCAWRAMAFW